jgi:hypothetical protein
MRKRNGRKTSRRRSNIVVDIGSILMKIMWNRSAMRWGSAIPAILID